jgi:hypothetical protein
MSKSVECWLIPRLLLAVNEMRTIKIQGAK